jgi:hypothetical protein
VRNGEEELDYDEEAKRYIELRFVQRVINVEEKTEEELPFRAKVCTEEDYSRSESQKAIF